jgi:hypothetical protein
MAIANGKFFTFAELRSKLSERQSVRIFDDDSIGQEREESVVLLMADADSEVTAHAVKNYPAQVASTVTATTCHPRLKQLALEWARANAYDRFPELQRGRDTTAELDRIQVKLRDLALGKTHLEGVTDQEANAQVEVRNGITLGGTTDRVFNCFGDF